MAIVRPGPYICAEWEFGGLPSWLLTYENMTIRCNDEVYVSKVKRYYNELLYFTNCAKAGAKVEKVSKKDEKARIFQIFRPKTIDKSTLTCYNI